MQIYVIQSGQSYIKDSGDNQPLSININRLWKVVDYTSKTVEIFLRKTNRLSDRSYIKEGGDVLIQSWKLLDQTSFFKEKQPVMLSRLLPKVDMWCVARFFSICTIQKTILQVKLQTSGCFHPPWVFFTFFK